LLGFAKTAYPNLQTISYFFAPWWLGERLF
jgi:hypothetical protein